MPVASVTPARIAGPVAVTLAPTNGAPLESVTLTVIVSVAADELVDGRGPRRGGLRRRRRGRWLRLGRPRRFDRGRRLGGHLGRAHRTPDEAGRHGHEARHEESRGRTNHARNLHRSSCAAGAGRRARAGRSRVDRFATSSRLADRTGEQVVEVRAAGEAGITQVTVDAAVDDADDRRHLADVAARPVSACGRGASPRDSAAAIPGSASSSVARAAHRRRGRAYSSGSDTRCRSETP